MLSMGGIITDLWVCGALGGAEHAAHPTDQRTASGKKR
jgi:hypothetical protein